MRGCSHAPPNQVPSNTLTTSLLPRYYMVTTSLLHGYYLVTTWLLPRYYMVTTSLLPRPYMLGTPAEVAILPGLWPHRRWATLSQCARFLALAW